MEDRPCFFLPCCSCVDNQCTDVRVRFDCEPNINGDVVDCDFHKGEGEEYTINEGNLSF